MVNPCPTGPGIYLPSHYLRHKESIMPRPIFRDSRPQPKGIRLGDLEDRETFLEQPGLPLNRLFQKRDKAYWPKNPKQICVLNMESDREHMLNADMIVYPCPIVISRAEDEPSIKNGSLMEWARNAVASTGQPVQIIGPQKDSLVLDEPWDALANVTDQRDKALKDISELVSELVKVKGERDSNAKTAAKCMAKMEQAIASRNEYGNELAKVKDERDKANERAEAFQARMLAYRKETAWRNGDLWFCDPRSNAIPASVDRRPYSSADEAYAAYDRHAGLGPLPA